MINIRQADIAKELNISRVTVSKALRNHPDISAAMKKKIGETARILGYVPNLIAKQLNSRKSYTIGIVVPDLENSFFSYVVDSMIDYATELNYKVILTVSREKQSLEKHNIENLMGLRVDGMLVCLSQETMETEIFKTIAKMKIPLVFFDRTFEDMKYSSVTFNDKAGAVDAINTVIKEGYKKIAHFAGYSTTSIGKQRAAGFTEAMKKNKIPVKKEWLIENGFEMKDGYESFMKLKKDNLPEIIFTVNDRVALGVYRAAKEAGLRIPDDLGIIGYGFSETTDLFDPPLTIINQNPRMLGSEATGLLLDIIDKNDPVTANRQVIDEEFHWGQSVKRKI